MFQLRSCQPNFHALRNMLYRIRKNNFGVVVVLYSRRVKYGSGEKREMGSDSHAIALLPAIRLHSSGTVHIPFLLLCELRPFSQRVLLHMPQRSSLGHAWGWISPGNQTAFEPVLYHCLVASKRLNSMS